MKAKEEIPSSPSSIKKALGFMADYFLYSEERLSAWLFLIASILCIAALVGLTLLFSWWSAAFWTALLAKDIALIAWNSLAFAGLVAGWIWGVSLKNYATEALSIQWRKWLTLKFVDKYLNGEHNYLDLSRLYKQIENPEQRIQEDIDTFVDKTISLGLGLIQAVFTLPVFITTLWIVGGAITFVAFGSVIAIPGYLVWVALAIAVVTGVITHLIARSLTRVNSDQANNEADFRKEMQSINQNAESIAQLQGEEYFQSSLTEKFKSIYDNAYEKLNIKTKLLSFQTLCQQMPMILPYLASAPLYIAGQIEMAQLMQVGMAFGEVNNSLGWFVNSYETLTEYNSSLGRLIELENALKGGLESSEKAICIHESDLSQLSVRALSITEPSSSQVILRGLELTFTAGENTVIKAPSGIGKSTLLKVMSGTWQYGSGDVTRPKEHQIYSLPQKPYLPNNTLRAALAFPKPSNQYSDEDYSKVLNEVGLGHFINKLDVSSDRWAQDLSGGQQQRVSLARALLCGAKWLFLDEATASLDCEGEQQLYQLITKQPDTTIISIAHRPTLDHFHHKMVIFKSNGSDEPVRVEELPISTNEI